MEGILSAGETYRLVEVEAPAGYERAADVEFTVEAPMLGPDENYVQHVEMIDQRTPVPPRSHSARTGDTPLAPLAAGVALAAAGVAAASALRQRRKQG